MRIVDFVPEEGVVALTATDGAGVVRELAATLARVHGLDEAPVTDALLARERLGSTALEHGVAAPHAKLPVSRTAGVVGLHREGVAFGAHDGRPVRVFLAFVSPAQGNTHLKALAAAARELSDATLLARLLGATGTGEAYRALCEVVEPGAAP